MPRHPLTHADLLQDRRHLEEQGITLGIVMAGAPPVDLVVHLHGVVYSAWILFFLVQTGLIAARRPDIHRVTGAVG